MKFDELRELYGEDLPVLLNNLTVLHNQYGNLTPNVVQKVVNLSNSLNGALLISDPKMNYPSIDNSLNCFFSASGKKYIINGTMNVDKYKQFENLAAQINAGCNALDLQNYLNQHEALMNESKIVKANALTEKFRHDLVLQKGVPELIMLACTLFMIPEGNTDIEWNEANSLEIVKDWQSIPYAFFLTSFVLFNSLFTEILKAGFQNSLQTQKVQKVGFLKKMSLIIKRILQP